MSRLTQTESDHVNTVPDGKCLCPDGHRQKVSMLRRSCVHQTSALSDYRVFADFFELMTRLSCVQQTNERSCQDFRAYNRLMSVHVKIFVRTTD